MNDTVRVVELLGTLSLACDAADGFPPETTMRSAVLAASLARRHGADDALVADAVVGGLLRHIGCTAFSVEEAHVYGAGDDIALRRLMATVDFGRPDEAIALITNHLAADAAPADRAAAVGALLGAGPSAGADHDAAQCDAGERLAALLPVSSRARDIATDAFERWDGHGGPRGSAGDDISLVARIVEVAYIAELFRSRQGRGGAAAELRARSGGHLDPQLVATFLEHAGELFDLVDDPGQPVWQMLLDAEPAPWANVSSASIDSTALAFGRFADLKSSYFAGHSEGVAGLVGAAAGVAGFDPDGIVVLQRAALLHDIGRVVVATGTWDAPRALSGPERDRVRFHAWETDRILSSTPLLGQYGMIAGGTHERLDGGGYHRNLGAAAIPPAARLLAACDVAVALGEARPHRPALGRAEIAATLAAEVDAGHLDRASVRAVLDVVGAGAGRVVPAAPAGLTDREVEVVRLLATGSSSKAVATHLGISTKTVSHHVAHIYDKVGCRSRAGLALFAVEHGLVGPSIQPSG